MRFCYILACGAGPVIPYRGGGWPEAWNLSTFVIEQVLAAESHNEAWC